jgi:uncharacterized protein YodC (DUF2158 family)
MTKQMEREMEFQPGDVVQLKSGGPSMSVESVGEDPHTKELSVCCTWFDKVGNRQVLNRERFSPAVLQKYDPMRKVGFHVVV